QNTHSPVGASRRSRSNFRAVAKTGMRRARLRRVKRLVLAAISSSITWHEWCEQNTRWNRVRALRPIVQGGEMLYYAVVFFIIALIAALFGFGGIAAGAAGIAKILFVVFLIVALVTFLLSLVRR